MAKILKPALTLGVGAAMMIVSVASARAALVCTAGNVIGTGTCTETVSLAPSLTAGFTAMPLTLDLWTSNAQLGFSETLTDATFTFGGSVDYTSHIRNFLAQTTYANLTTTSTFDFAAGAGSPATFLPAGTTTADTTIVNFVLSPNQTALFGFVATLPNKSITDTTGLDQFTGPGTFQTLVSYGLNYGITGGPQPGDTAGLGTVSVVSPQGGLLGTATPTVTVTYDFTTTAGTQTVPEPAGNAVFGVGLLALASLRRRPPGRKAI